MAWIEKIAKPVVYLGASAAFVYMFDKYLLRKYLEEYYLEKAKKSGVDIIDITKIITFGIKAGSCQSCVNPDSGSWNILKCKSLDCNSGRISYLMDFVRNAKHSVDVCLYSFSSGYCKKVFEDAHRKGVAVRVILNCEHAFSPDSPLKHYLKIGIPVRTKNSRFYMHNKIIIVDNEILITGSLNLTNKAIMCHHETVAIISRPVVVKKYAEVFQNLWTEFAQK